MIKWRLFLFYNVFIMEDFPISALCQLQSTHSDMFSFHFHSVQLFFKIISLEASFFTYGLFRTVLFSFQVSKIFPVLFLLLISYLISLWLEISWTCMILILHLLICALWSRIWSTMVNILWMLEESCVLLLLGDIFYKGQLDPPD